MGTPACGGGEPAYQFRALSYVTAHPFLRHLWAREVALNDIGPGLRGVLGDRVHSSSVRPMMEEMIICQDSVA